MSQYVVINRREKKITTECKQIEKKGGKQKFFLDES
jgi:hypothetical protein